MAGEVDNLSEIESILSSENEEGEVTLGKEGEVNPPAQEEDDLENINLDNEEENLGEKEEEGEEKEGEITLPQFKEITKKYPNFFKDFPNLRHAFFREKEYSEVFPTVDDAKSAQEDIAGLRELESAIVHGEESDVVGVLDAIKDLSEDAVTNFSINFLPALRKVNQDAYYEVITPELVNFTRSMFDAGLRNGNENLKNAALHAAQYFFKNTKIATGEQDVAQPSRKAKEPENGDLNKERSSFQRERYTSLYNDVVSESNSKLMDLIMDGIDPRDTMTDGIKTLIAEKVAKEIDNILGKNTSHRSKMDSIWKKAGEAGFSTSFRNKIISAYLESVKQILPKVRSKVRSSTLGTRERNSEKSEIKTERREPKNNTGGGGSSNSSSHSRSNGKSDKDIDWSKTTDLQYLQGKITYYKD